MVDAAPFAALRYDPAVAGEPASTSAPAYDDLERFTYARHRTVSPYTVLELLTGETDEYRTAATAFDRWLRTGVLREDPAPAYYLYEIHELHRGVPTVLRGVLAAVSVNSDTLLPHEGVDEVRVATRMRRLHAVPADLAPVFAVHTPGPAQLREALDAPPRRPPVVAFTDESGTDHRIWALTDDDVVAAVTTGLAGVRAVIADGHHRYAAAQLLHAENPSVDRTLVYLVDGSAYGPRLDALHRIVRPVPVDLPQRLRSVFDVSPVPMDTLLEELPRQRGAAFGLITGPSGCHLLAPRADLALDDLADGHSTAWRSLPAAVWEHGVRPLVGGGEVLYRSDVVAAAAEVRTETAALFVLQSPNLDDIFACAFSGESMPPKSTWFRPKPRAGLLMRSLHSSR